MGMMDEAKAGKELFATFDTTEGKVVVRLFSKDAPKTVENFVGLATGEREWTHPANDQKQKNKPLYDGTIFHRCINNFMVQGGDPLGRGTGGPGYKFDGEYAKHVRHDRPGLLSMANAGPGTDGSQFFLTFVPTPWLDGKHTIFGAVEAGDDTLRALEACGSPSGRTSERLMLDKVTIEIG